MRQLAQIMLQQRGELVGWIPVALALGIGSYFSILYEPSLVFYLIVAGIIAVMLAFAKLLPEAASPLAIAVALGLTGFLLAGVRAHSVAGPVLGWRYYGPIEGRVVAIDRSQSDALRLTLDQVRLDRVTPDRTPQNVRISLHGDQSASVTPEPGLRVMTTGHLSPPSGPVEPDGFDFQRHAWFVSLGAVGYTRVPLLAMAQASEGHTGMGVFRIRMAASARIQRTLPGDIGGFAAAITTGDRSAISRMALENLRVTNLAHLLAISGLHMGLLTAVVLGGLRILLSLHTGTALRLPTKSIAAVGALIAATGYLMLSGGNVATERAFIMVAVALGALMIGRRALSLRAVAIAAIIVLSLRPEALTGPGFQMSFAATTALVAVFGWLRNVQTDRVPQLLKPVLAVVISSAVAGMATAPIGAAHFNTISNYGLIANLASVPLMGVLVIPAAVVALVLAPLGLDWIALWFMGLGLRWILGVAEFIAGLEDAQSYVAGPGGWVLPLLALGFLVLVLWQGRLRFVGLPMMAAAFVMWHGTARPEVLVADTGGLVGLMTPQGRALSKEKGAGFVARNWLENDGDGAPQYVAAARWSEGPVIHLSGKRAVAGFSGCAGRQIVIASVDAPHLARATCEVFDPSRLKHTGALAMKQSDTGWQITTARERTGERLWTRWPKPQPDQYVRINPTKRP